jgi:hypothetical protein
MMCSTCPLALFCLSGHVPRSVAMWCVDCWRVVRKPQRYDEKETKIICPHHFEFTQRLESVLQYKKADGDQYSVCADCRLKRRLKRRKEQRLRRLQPKRKA